MNKAEVSDCIFIKNKAYNLTALALKNGSKSVFTELVAKHRAGLN